MMTAPSTIKPKSSAPKLIKFADTPVLTMPVIVINMASGMIAAVINAARRLPNNRNSTATTSKEPSNKFLLTVAMALSTNAVRSYTGVAITPSGNDACTSLSRLATFWATVREFSPINIMAVPSTVSTPSWVAAPVRNSLPIAILATSFIFIGIVSCDVITTLPISSMLANWPGERTNSC